MLYVHNCIYIYIYIYTHTHTHTLHKHLYCIYSIHTHTHTHTQAYVCVCVCVCVCFCVLTILMHIYKSTILPLVVHVAKYMSFEGFCKNIHAVSSLYIANFKCFWPYGTVHSTVSVGKFCVSTGASGDLVICTGKRAQYSMSSVGFIIWWWGEGSRSWEWAGTGGCRLERKRKMEGGRRNRGSGQKSGGGECMSGQEGVDRFQAQHFQTDWMAKVKGSHFLWKRGCLKRASSVCRLDVFGARSRTHVQTDGVACMQFQTWKQVWKDYWSELCFITTIWHQNCSQGPHLYKARPAIGLWDEGRTFI